MTGTVRVKYTYRISDDRRGDIEDLPLLSVSIHRGVIPRSKLTNAEPRAEDLSNYKLVNAGDIVINRMSAYQGALGIAHERGIASPEYIVIQPHDNVDPRYLTYLFKSTWFVSQMSSRLRGIGGTEQGNVRTPRINPEDLGSIVVDLPSRGHQAVVADYLDTESARIDALIEKKQRMVALLTERRTAALGSLVDGSGPPVAVRFVTSRITSGPRGWSDFASDTGSPFIRIANVQRRSIELDMTDTLLVSAPNGAESHRTRVVEGDVLVTITADIGSVGVARKNHAGSFVSQHIALLTPKGCRPEWLAFAIAAPGSRASLDASQYGGTKTQLGLGDVAALRIPVPKLDEQDRVIDLLRRETSRLERLNQRIDSQIALLKERRQALITAAVTGQLDIPEVAA